MKTACPKVLLTKAEKKDNMAYDIGIYDIGIYDMEYMI